ncbi:MAG: hypothetical protein V2A55_01550 [Candidatus Jorgensenbacteria bacterium]
MYNVASWKFFPVPAATNGWQSKPSLLAENEREATMSKTQKFFVSLGAVAVIVYAVITNDWWIGVLNTDPYGDIDVVDRVLVGMFSILLTAIALGVVFLALHLITYITGLQKLAKWAVYRYQFKRYFGVAAPRTSQEGKLLQALVYRKLCSYADRFRDCGARETGMLEDEPAAGGEGIALDKYRYLRTELLCAKRRFWNVHGVACKAPGITVGSNLDHYLPRR